ncbi:recombination hotspot-binding protein [Grosmannia clavigera kw1407]|uniref:Recombination hotspot-binding protein n=1 Tax=Grosmannia clavigera (strain kw1407 / UAMH 11150) TaxID=655863 RepID=F0XG88_GROCL|nr:recombination hotspot-binding protein [Grosmannia clavigera kw1407]EFX02911.1 recombination hotspot-binding protein [Grosmannia clavigera kw1407]
MINPRVFESLRARAEQETSARAAIDGLVEALERSVAYAQGVLSRVHATPRARYADLLLPAAEAAVADETAKIRQLAEVASAHPYYKFNNRWTRHLQDAIATVLLTAWLGGSVGGSSGGSTDPGELGRLLTLEEVGEALGVPVDGPVDAAAAQTDVDVGAEDRFHVALDEYLSALTMLADELGRLAMNAVTLGDGALAVRISRFVKELHGGFQLLNLKNDFLRKRVDGVKYAVKRVEGVIYDLALRNLLPAEVGAESEDGETKTVAAATAAEKATDSRMGEA